MTTRGQRATFVRRDSPEAIYTAMTRYSAIILAAGKGTRMKSHLCKVLHPIAGKPMILYVIDAVRSAGIEKLVVVTGHQADHVRRCLDQDKVECVIQEPQLGTGHAVAAAKGSFSDFRGHVLILCGDTPLIEPQTITDLMGFHGGANSRLTVLTMVLEDPTGYGRIVRDETGRVSRIVEERDADDEEKRIREVNTGIYVADCGLLFSLIEAIRPENAQGEYYLTDMAAEAVRRQIPVHGCVLRESLLAMGVNTRIDLAEASREIWSRRRRRLMLGGVTLLDPESVFVDNEVEVAPDTVIHHTVTLAGKTRIGRDCVIEPGVFIRDSLIGDRVNVLLGSRLDCAVVEDGTSVGPMAHLRPEARIGKNARIGNFVEVKKSVVGDGTKAAHLTYLGDSTIGSDVNIGCGTITCNYDGKKKHRTVIHDGCFIGSDVQFIAPVEIGEGSLIGAGSTITRNVPPGTLAVSRARQKEYPLRRGQGPKPSDEDKKP